MLNYRKYFAYTLIIFLIAMMIVGISVKVLSLYRQHNERVSEDYNSKIIALQKQISGIQGQITALIKENAAVALSTKEIANRQIMDKKSERQSVTDTVSKVVPAVVSIVITQNIPQYQIQYKNPFGDDPFFQDVTWY